MDVHPPHEPIHTKRDFFLHLFTITIGLLIALSLEGLVELVQNRHLLHTAETDLRIQLADNRSTLAGDERQLEASDREIAANIAILEALQNHVPPTGDLDFQWHWNSVQSSAWDTARDTGAVALMPYETAQAYSLINTQQTLVNDQAHHYIQALYRSGVSMQGRKLASLQPPDIERMIVNSQEALVDLNYLRDLCHSLDSIYKRADDAL